MVGAYRARMARFNGHSAHSSTCRSKTPIGTPYVDASSIAIEPVAVPVFIKERPTGTLCTGTARFSPCPRLIANLYVGKAAAGADVQSVTPVVEAAGNCHWCGTTS